MFCREASRTTSSSLPGNKCEPGKVSTERMVIGLYCMAFSASANADLLKQSSLKTTSPIDEDRASMSAAALNVLDSFTDYQPVTAEGN